MKINGKHFIPAMLCIPAFSSCTDRAVTPPNILFIMADDLGWTDLSCYGSSFYETPCIDSLAQAGVRFTDAYAACPVSSPTRVSFQTGRYPAREHITDWIPGKQGGAKKLMKEICPVIPPDFVLNMPLERVTIAEALKESGYSTAHIGKWHCCLPDSTYFPQHQGYDYNIGGCGLGSPSGPDPYFTPYNNPMLPDGPEGEYLTDRLGDECVKMIGTLKEKGKPFFINLAFHQVHIPLRAKPGTEKHFEEKARETGLDRIYPFNDNPEYISQQPFDRKMTALRERTVQSNPVYAAMLASLDENIGKVVDELKRQGLYENTIIMFFSDNGGVSTSEGSPTSNLPLRAGKGFCYEGGIREPLIVVWDGHIKGGRTSDAIVTSTDFYPTLLDMAGLPLRPEEHLDGKSFKTALEGGEYDRGDIFWHYPHYSNQGSRPSGAIRSGDWKLIEYYDTDEVELYNLRDDIGETRDLSGEMPERVEELQARFHEWLKETDASMPMKNMK